MTIVIDIFLENFITKNLVWLMKDKILQENIMEFMKVAPLFWYIGGTWRKKALL